MQSTTSPSACLRHRRDHDRCGAQALARQGLFGRGLPAGEQTFVVVTDSVAKQLDGLKRDPALSAAVRRFWSHGLDACGPAGNTSSARCAAASAPSISRTQLERWSRFTVGFSPFGSFLRR